MVALDLRLHTLEFLVADGLGDLLGLVRGDALDQAAGDPVGLPGELRVSGKKKDDLQAVIALLKEKDFGIALQFTNYR